MWLSTRFRRFRLLQPDAVSTEEVDKHAENERRVSGLNGSILVMEIYNAKKNAEGTFEKSADGNLVKADLAKVFVMQKGAGWGKGAPENLKNGDWIYSAFKPNGERLDVDYTACSGCHLPLGESKDNAHRYDEYFEKRLH